MRNWPSVLKFSLSIPSNSENMIRAQRFRSNYTIWHENIVDLSDILVLQIVGDEWFESIHLCKFKVLDVQ